MKQQKSNNGITLIALIITIIVLLILAVVSIRLAINGGIIGKTEQATEANEQAALEEEVKLKVAEKKAAEYEGTNQNYDLGHYLEEIKDASVTKIENTDAWYVTRRTAEVTVYDDGSLVAGTINIWDGETIETPEIDGFNWNIYNCAQFKFFADFVNNGNALTEEQKTLVAEKGYNEEDIAITEETQVNLMTNLDLGARQANGELTSGKEWTPIGKTSDLKFIGKFNGNNSLIKSIYIKQSSNNYIGIFGVVNGEISNLEVVNGYIEGNQRVGGIVGILEAGTIENCKNTNTFIIGQNYTGGITGQAYTSAIVNSCNNTGKVNGLNYVGGIVGLASQSSTISRCSNTGEVKATGYIGGIAGEAATSSQVNNCINEGIVIGEESTVGGIVGLAYNSSITSYCTNMGKITGKGNAVGGIIGGTGTSTTIDNCINKGAVTGEGSIIGGIVGSANTTATVNGCKNEGIISGKQGQGIGGISGGLADSSILTNCSNTAEISAIRYVGGISGMLGNSTGNIQLKGCYNTGRIQGNSLVGALVGYSIGDNEITRCYYLTGTYNKGVNNVDDEDDNIEVKSEEEMTRQDFVDKLNEGTNTNAWKYEEGNYPILNTNQ